MTKPVNEYTYAELDDLSDGLLDWPLTYVDLASIVRFLLDTETTRGLELANLLNEKCGASARRFAVRKILQQHLDATAVKA